MLRQGQKGKFSFLLLCFCPRSERGKSFPRICIEIKNSFKSREMLKVENTIKADSKTITVGTNPIHTKGVAIIIKPHTKNDTTIIYKTIIRFSSLLLHRGKKNFFICFSSNSTFSFLVTDFNINFNKAGTFCSVN